VKKLWRLFEVSNSFENLKYKTHEEIKEFCLFPRKTIGPRFAHIMPIFLSAGGKKHSMTSSVVGSRKSKAILLGESSKTFMSRFGSAMTVKISRKNMTKTRTLWRRRPKQSREMYSKEKVRVGEKGREGMEILEWMTAMTTIIEVKGSVRRGWGRSLKAVGSRSTQEQEQEREREQE
jgi:hypothetical protein